MMIIALGRVVLDPPLVRCSSFSRKEKTSPNFTMGW